MERFTVMVNKAYRAHTIVLILAAEIILVNQLAVTEDQKTVNISVRPLQDLIRTRRNGAFLQFHILERVCRNAVI